MFPLLSIPAMDDLPEWMGWPMWGALSLSWGAIIASLLRKASR
jgi:hypothetical protein